MTEETDPIDRAFEEAIEAVSETKHWKCRNCGKTFQSGRDARQHCFGEHDSPKGVERVTTQE